MKPKIASETASLSIEVEVNEYCFSACANYICAAGIRKVVPAGSILGFHGGVTASQVARHKASPLPIPLKRALLDATSMHIPLYSKLKLNDQLIECSARYAAKEVEVRASDNNLAFSGTRSSLVFTPPLDQLKQAGARGVIEYSMPSSENDAREILDRIGLRTVVPRIGIC